MQDELGTISHEAKAKILGLNLAKLYDLDVPEELRLPESKEDGAIGSEPVSVA
jgi:hypothetical protein